MVVSLFNAFLEEREFVEKIGRVKNGLVSTCSFLHTSNAEKPHLSFPLTTQASLITFSAATRMSETWLGPGLTL